MNNLHKDRFHKLFQELKRRTHPGDPVLHNRPLDVSRDMCGALRHRPSQGVVVPLGVLDLTFKRLDQKLVSGGNGEPSNRLNLSAIPLQKRNHTVGNLLNLDSRPVLGVKIIAPKRLGMVHSH